MVYLIVLNHSLAGLAPQWAMSKIAGVSQSGAKWSADCMEDKAVVKYPITIQPLSSLTGAFRGAVHLQVKSEPFEYSKRRSSLMQPE
jgi:hypothetical protein